MAGGWHSHRFGLRFDSCGQRRNLGHAKALTLAVLLTVSWKGTGLSLYSMCTVNG